MTTKTNLDVNVHVDAKKKWKKSSWSTLAKKSKDIDGKKKTRRRPWKNCLFMHVEEILNVDVNIDVDVDFD